MKLGDVVLVTEDVGSGARSVRGGGSFVSAFSCRSNSMMAHRAVVSKAEGQGFDSTCSRPFLRLDMSIYRLPTVLLSDGTDPNTSRL